ncbi:hypothetical protein DPEC_G00319800 [Dallia pectoralis]|uniref:Uncharacterized protein n=1 Tax=Dallia pectoralis TaxID=75939 RepID=A0ACC2F9S2_DALPE|nr:hypothetical protein DPEC_G00319800 [Dallia pectoralis]
MTLQLHVTLDQMWRLRHESTRKSGAFVEFTHTSFSTSPDRYKAKAMKIWFLSALVLVCRCRGASPCPDLCKCHMTEVVCNDVPLTQFPSEGMPGTTTSLTIQFTNISSISELHLGATPLLQELYLYNNILTSLPADLFRGVPLLSTVALSDNKLDRLPANVFGHAPLKTLVLKNNLIDRVNADWLSDNSNLTWLDLSGNRLTAVPAALLQKLRCLENLDLSHNRLEKIQPNSLGPLIRLERLNLEGNKLSTLDPSTFSSNVNLTHLFLLANRLEQLPSTLFQGLANLQHLSLDNNRLRCISPGLLDPLHSIAEEGLDITGNPWMCDKKVEYLWRWLQKNLKKMFMANNLRCASPDSLKERPVMSLTDSDIGL